LRFHVTENLKTPPQFQVGLKPISETEWLLPDDGAYFLEEKQHLLDTEPVFAAFEDSITEQIEAANIIAKNISVDYRNDEPPLKAISRHISDDTIIMAKRDGEWKLIALSLCSPTFFNADYALGKSLHLLHEPIPTGDFKLSDRIARIFDNLKPDNILERFNWTVQWSDKRYTPDGSFMRKMADDGDINDAAAMLYERVERQTIRLLPETGALLFTIRIRLTKVRDILQDSDARQYFANAWQNAPLNVRTYKKWSHLERHLKHLLQL
jgi:hypothetical protein